MANHWKEPNPYFFWQTEELAELFAQRAAQGKHIYAFGDSTLHYHTGEKRDTRYRVVVFHAKQHGRNHLDRKFREAGWKEVNERINFSPRVKIYRALGPDAQEVELPDRYDQVAVGLGWMDTAKEFCLMVLTVALLWFLLLFMKGRTLHMMQDTLPALMVAFAVASGLMAYRRVQEYLTYKKWQSDPGAVQPDANTTERVFRWVLAVVFAVMIGTMLAHQIGSGSYDVLSAEREAKLPFSGQITGETHLEVCKSYLIPEATLLTVKTPEGSWEENRYDCAAAFLATRVASDFSETLLMQDYSEEAFGEDTYLYRDPQSSDWGLLWFRGREVVTVLNRGLLQDPQAVAQALRQNA